MQRAYAPRGLRFLPKLAIIITVGMITAVASYQAAAVDVFTDPVGFYQLPMQTNSDTFVSMPFSQIPAARGAVGSVALPNVITVSGSPGYSIGQWSTPSTPGNFMPFYVYMVSGASAGATYTITNNDASTLRVITSPTGLESLGSVAPGDLFQIIPFWTLGTAFPSSCVVASTVLPPKQNTQVLFPDLTTANKNLTPSAFYYFFNNAWRKLNVANTSNFNDVVILPDQYVIVRQNNNATTTNVTLGQVTLANAHIGIDSNPSGGSLVQWDNALCIARPSTYTLDQSGLSGIVAASTTLPPVIKDQVLVFDNALQAKNKTQLATYYFLNNHWRKLNVANTIDFGPSNVFNPGDGIIFRAFTNSATVRIWNNLPNY